MKFKSKPRIIEAEKWNGGLGQAGVRFREGSSEDWDHFATCTPREDEYFVITAQGRQATLTEGDWIIQDGLPDTYYPCSDSELFARYEPA